MPDRSTHQIWLQTYRKTKIRHRHGTRGRGMGYHEYYAGHVIPAPEDRLVFRAHLQHGETSHRRRGGNHFLGESFRFGIWEDDGSILMESPRRSMGITFTSLDFESSTTSLESKTLNCRGELSCVSKENSLVKTIKILRPNALHDAFRGDWLVLDRGRLLPCLWNYDSGESGRSTS